MTVTQLVTADELMAMPEPPDKHYELVKGRLVEVPGSTALHGFIAGLLYHLIDGFARERRLGLAFGDNVSYLLERDPDLLRIPDVSFVARGRIPESGIPDSYWPFAPDLAVEIVSSGDRASELYGKVREYLAAGTRMVWVVWPQHRAVTVYTPDGETTLQADQELSGGDVLPGFRVTVGELFESTW